MWQRFTERARKLVFYAQEAAQKHGEGFVSTEHLLLAICREPDSTAARVIEKLGVDITRVQDEVEKQMPRGDQVAYEMTLTPRAKRVIDLGYQEARELDNNYIGTEHILLGLIREGDGLAGRVLAHVGIKLESARAEVVALQGSEPQPYVAASVANSFRPGRLCRRHDSALLVIDLQDSFLAPIADKDRALYRSSFLIEIADLLDVPTIATEQYATRMGTTNEQIKSALKGAPRYDKLCFSSCRDDDFWTAWKVLNRKQAIVVGIETHICVNQTVHDLLSRGVEVFVCADAIAARLSDAHEIALNRMRDSRAVITHTESVAYEWLGEAGTPEFKSCLEVIKKYAQ